MRYIDGFIASGIPTAPVPVVNMPVGYTVARLRFRANDVITAYFRNGDTFSRWYLRWTDDACTALEPMSCIGANYRSARAAAPPPL